MSKGELKRKGRGGGGPEGDSPTIIDFDPQEVRDAFRVHSLLRELGLRSWLLLGIALMLGVLVWLASLTQVIVIPLIVAAILAAVAAPVVRWVEERRVSRGLATFLVMLGIAVVGAGMGLAVLSGVVSQAPAISAELEAAADSIKTALVDLGVSQAEAEQAKENLTDGSTSSVSALLNGVVSGVENLSSFVFFLAMVVLSLFFLLKDGPQMRAWVEGHSKLPTQVARVVSGDTIRALRGYFTGVTLVAAFSAAIVGVGSLVLGLPSVGAIVVITFVAGYIPYIGAWTAGIFTVLIALGSQGTEAAVAMAVLQLLANGALQQIVQPLAMGAALGIHPLVVLVVTIAGGAIFGMIGMIIAAPLVAAGVRIKSDLDEAGKWAAERAAEH